MNNEIVKLSKISKKFHGTDKNIVVLRNINLKIKKGELISLSGPSGSGKSTLLHIIALLDQPTTGEVFFKKKNFSTSNNDEKDNIKAPDEPVVIIILLGFKSKLYHSPYNLDILFLSSGNPKVTV